MKRIALIAASLFVIGMVVSCAERTPEEKLIAHWEHIINLLKENRTEPTAAATAITAYLNDHLQEMKQLTGELGGEAGRTVISSSEFIKAESRNRAAIRELEEEAPSLMQDPAVENALAPLEDLGL